MHSVKTTLILSLTTLISLAGYIAYNSHQDRFILLPIQTDKSIYVFDRKSNTLNYCTSDNQCKLIKMNLPAEHVSAGSMLPASLLNILEGKNSKGKEDANASKKLADHKRSVTVAATHAASAPATQAKQPALVPADVHTPSAVLPMPAMAALPSASTGTVDAHTPSVVSPQPAPTAPAEAEPQPAPLASNTQQTAAP